MCFSRKGFLMPERGGWGVGVRPLMPPFGGFSLSGLKGLGSQMP